MECRFVNRLPLWLLCWLPFLSGLACLAVYLLMPQLMGRDVTANQQSNLSVAATSIARLLRDDARFVDLVPSMDRAIYRSEQLTEEITLDGRRDEWGAVTSQRLGLDHLLEIRFPYKSDDLSFSLSVGSDDARLYLHVEVKDDFVVYRSVGGISVHRNDHVRIAFVDPQGVFRKLTLAVTQPGEVTAMIVSESGRALRPFAELTGRWMATESGYNLELSVRQDVIGDKLSLVVVDVDDERLREIKFMMGLSHTESPDLLGQLVYSPTRFERLLADLPYAVRVQSAQGEMISSSGFEAITDPVEASAAIAKDGAELGLVILRQSKTSANLLLVRINQQTLLILGVTLLMIGLMSGIAAWLVMIKLQRSQARLNGMLMGNLDDEAPLPVSSKEGSFKDGSVEKGSVNDSVGRFEDNLGANVLRLRQHNDYLERMASRLSHELRTPVSVVKSSLENLQDSTLSKDASIYVERAHLGIQRLTNIMNKLAEARRLEEALDEDEMIRFDLAKLVSGCVSGYESAFSEVGFELLLEQDEIPVTGIPELMAQLLDKLVDNAAEFSTAPLIKLRVSVEGDTAIMRIMNEGPTLPNGNSGQTLFESMTSVRQSGRDSESHLGLGLYIAKVIADFHGASLTVANREDVQGVTVTMGVPLLRLTSKLL
ncbi:MAG: two-component system sensor histidine kinase ChvG [Candidatus Azotimanducaceae bacterium]|jgi:two-component system sensor histidine kinase ChvG